MRVARCKVEITPIKLKCSDSEKNILHLNTFFTKSASVWILYINCLIFLVFFCGCSAFGPPIDYYQKTVDMEHGEQTRYETGKNTEEAESPESKGSVKIIKRPSEEPPIVEVLPKPKQDESNLSTVKQNKTEQIKQESTVGASPTLFPDMSVSNPKLDLNPKPIAISSDVIRTALEIAGINVRSVELINRRIESGKNSVRINFICDSSSVVNDKFFTICAVIYHLNKSSKTVDVVVGIAEDSQTSLLGALQSNTEDITAWMDNKITRAEWFSRITRKML
jgi:hypothetical protein